MINSNRNTVILCYLFTLLACSSKAPKEAVVIPTEIDSSHWRKSIDFPFEEQPNFKPIVNPSFRVTTLPNGIKVHLLHREGALYTNIRYLVINEFAHNPLLTELVQEFFAYGSENIMDKNFKIFMRNYGTNFSHLQGPDFSESTIDVMSHDKNGILKMLGDIIKHPNFSKENFDKVKRQVALNNKISGVVGQQSAQQTFFRLLYGEEHPYGTRNNDSAALEEISLESIVNYYFQTMQPAPSHLIIAGHIDNPERLLTTIKQAFDFKKNRVTAKQVKLKQPNLDNDIYFIHRPNAQQVNIISGLLASPKRSPEWFYQSSLANVLGGGSHSRLFKDLRESRGLTYTIRASMPPRKLTSPFYISTSCGHHKVAAMLTGIFQHRDYLMNQPLTKEELEFHKRHLLGRLAFFRETPSQLAWHYSRRLVFGEADDALENYQQNTLNLNANRIQHSAKALFSKPWITVMVGDYQQVRTQLNKYFPELRVKIQSD